MRRSVLIPAVMAAVVLGAAVPAMADDLVGKLVDHACYMTRGPNEAKGTNHDRCAIACAQKGHRLALVTATGEVYIVTGPVAENNNAMLIPLMKYAVVLTGTVREVAVQASAIQDNNAPGDGRRLVSKDGVVKIAVRKGDFREGDVPAGVVRIIEAISVRRVVLPTK